MSLIQDESNSRKGEYMGSIQGIDSRRAVVHVCNMKMEFKEFCLRISEELLTAHLKEDCKVFQILAEKIKLGMDKKLGPTWHVCVGTEFGSFVGFEKNSMIIFAIQKYFFLIWKHL